MPDSLFRVMSFQQEWLDISTASLKNVKDTRVGDTVTDADNPCAEPLPGYKKVNPMVYCGMYPADSCQISGSERCTGKTAAQRCGTSV